MLTYNGIHHTALVTSDLEATIRFWRDLLELRLVWGSGGTGHRQYFFEVSANNLIAFFSWDGAEPVPEKDAGRAVPGPVAFDHVCLELGDGDQLWYLKDRLEAAGNWVSEVLDNGFIHSIFTFDPNGIAVELCCAVPDVDLRGGPRMTDAAPGEAALEGPEPRPSRWPTVARPTPRGERTTYPGGLGSIFEKENRWGED